MPTCPKCGSQVSEEMSFCPKCGAPLKVQAAPSTQPSPRPYRRDEKSEKYERGEKREKGEKSEKNEKHGYAFVGPLVGGLVLIFLGLALFVSLYYPNAGTIVGAILLVMVGIVIIFGAIYGAVMAGRRHPRT